MINQYGFNTLQIGVNTAATSTGFLVIPASTVANAGATGMAIAVLGLIICSTGANFITFNSGATDSGGITAVSPAFPIAAGQTIPLEFSQGAWFQCSGGASFTATTSGAVPVSLHATYCYTPTSQ